MLPQELTGQHKQRIICYTMLKQNPDTAVCVCLCNGVYTVYPKKYAHGFVVLCFVVVMQSFIMNSHEVFIHIHQGCFAGTGAIVRLPQCQWSKPDGYGKISQCITTTKHSKAKTVCIFLGIYCTCMCTCIIDVIMKHADKNLGLINPGMLQTVNSRDVHSKLYETSS